MERGTIALAYQPFVRAVVSVVYDRMSWVEQVAVGFAIGFGCVSLALILVG